MKTNLLLLGCLLVSLPLQASVSAEAGYTAHEWGTFTSVQGPDGVPLEWNPIVTSDLPEFVYDFRRATFPDGPAGFSAVDFLKGSRMALQRMETPVIYFYSEQERAVEVRVDFPDGLITEWFPRAQVTRAAGAIGGARSGSLRWENLRVLPAAPHRALAAQLPTGTPGSHYYAARETDGAFVVSEAPGKGAQREYEKFLFYRGLGFFRTPLEFKLVNHDERQVQLHNQGDTDLHDLFLLHIRAGQATYRFVPSLAAQETHRVQWGDDTRGQSIGKVGDTLARQMRARLMSHGLNEAEASAMVKTWRDSWFEEEGLRVLYVLPRAWTDRVLPLELKPPPREIVRVMVGRAEMITPSTQWHFLKQVARWADGQESDRAAAVKQVRAVAEGRFAEPTARLVSQTVAGDEFAQASRELLAAARPVKP